MASSLRSLQAGSKEAAILLDLLQGSSGQAYASSNNGWDKSTPVCEWKGVTCDASSGVVESVDVSNGSLEGTLPNSLGDLTTLLHLTLSNNKFEGSIPYQVVSMPNLKTLDLSFNNLSWMIPFPMGRSLETVHLGHNQLTGDVPSSFSSDFRNVKIFDLKYNLLHGALPSPTGLPDIQTMDFSNNKFTNSIPTAFGDLTSLQSLYLSNNRLTGTIPHELGDTRMSLRQLFLHGNILTGTLPAALADLRGLDILFVDDNRLTGSVPTELCAMSLNEVFFHNTGDVEDVDSDYSDLYGRRLSSSKSSVPLPRAANQSRKMREGDPENERDGCTSIACPSGYKSKGDNNKDGVFPCEKCGDSSLNPYIGSNTCYDIDQDTIISSLYQATNGPSWSGAQNWGDSSTATCDKEGITCNDQKQITRIVLQDRGLAGTLPPGLGFLDRLVEFDVSHNNIGGLLPADLRFAPLEVLDVAENQMTGYVPIGLCQKAGINGNGKDGLYTCDTIACRAAFHSSTGRAGAGMKGERCKLCSSETDAVLGIIGCNEAYSEGITPFGLVGEIAIAIFGLTMICVVFFIWRRSKLAKDYMKNRAYFTHGPGQDEEPPPPQPDYTENDDVFLDEMDPLAGIDGIADDRGIANIEVKVKDEWNGGKETTQKEVWLDVPKIA